MKWKTKEKIKEAEQLLLGVKAPLPFNDEGACCFDGKRWYVVTAHGQQTQIIDGDYIVREPDGRGFYPCKPDIWLAGHELIEE